MCRSATSTYFSIHQSLSPFQSTLRDELDNSMERRHSWEANSHAASQDIPLLSWSPKVYYSVHSSPLLIPILRQMNPVHIFTLCFFNMHFNIISPPTPKSPKWSLPFRFSNQNFVSISHLFHMSYMIHDQRSWKSVVKVTRNQESWLCHVPVSLDVIWSPQLKQRP